MAVEHLNEQNFEQNVRNQNGPVLIDFWANWCMPCRMLGPVLEQVAQDMPEAKIFKVNVDESPALAQAFRVSSIPMLVVIENNQVVETKVGLQSKEAVKAMLQR